MWLMKTIKSKVCNIKWKVNNEGELGQQDIEFIENMDCDIYCNDTTGCLWAFDTKLPSGKWLENIQFNGSITEAKALVLGV